MHLWDACREAEDDYPDLAALAKSPCYGGLDFASMHDLTAFALVCPIRDKVYLEVFYWMAEEGLAERAHRDNVPYPQWARDGHIELTEGNRTDFDVVGDKIVAISKRLNVKQIGFDHYEAGPTINKLQAAGIECLDLRQGFGLTNGAKRFEDLVASGKLQHDGCPVLRFNVEHASIKRDEMGNIRVVKPTFNPGSKRIDGVVAAVMATSLMHVAPVKKPSLYSAEGWAAAGRSGRPGVLSL